MKAKFLRLVTIFLLLLPLCVVLLGAGCDDDNDGEYTEIEFFKFSDFGCENDNSWSLNDGYEDENYIVTSQQEFDKIVNMECSPQIDFLSYTILAGSKQFSNGVSIYEEKVEENNSEIVYTVTFLTDDSTVALKVSYYVIIKKTSAKNIRIVEVVKETE